MKKKLLNIVGSGVGILVLIGLTILLALTLSRRTTPGPTSTPAALRPATPTPTSESLDSPLSKPTESRTEQLPTTTATPDTVFESPLQTPTPTSELPSPTPELPPPTPDPDGWLAEKLRIISDEPFEIDVFPIEINDDIWRPVWSPDGKHVIVDRVTGAKQVSPTLMLPIQELWVLDLEGNGMLLASNAAMSGDWSPDGDRIAYLHRPDPLRYDQYEVWVATWPGAEKQRIAEHVRFGTPLWLSNDRVIFSSTNGRIKSALPETKQIEDVIPGQEWTARAADVTVFSVSPDGQWLVVQSERLSDSKLALVSLQDGTWRAIPSDPKKGFAYILGGLAWSPDSRRLALSTSQNDIHIVDLHLKHEWEISTGGETPSAFSWSPDGNMLLVVLRSSSQLLHIYAVNIDGSGWRDLSHDENIGVLTPTWSPDGRYIFYSEYSYQDSTKRPRLMTVVSR